MRNFNSKCGTKIQKKENAERQLGKIIWREPGRSWAERLFFLLAEIVKMDLLIA